jgi:hypothetical protein
MLMYCASKLLARHIGVLIVLTKWRTDHHLVTSATDVVRLRSVSFRFEGVIGNSLYICSIMFDSARRYPKDTCAKNVAG